MPQLGRARATAADDDTTDLAHRAFSSHVELGATFAHAWPPRVAVLHDYATGDRDPADDACERFDRRVGALHRGRFARTAAQGSTADPAYAYVQLTLHL
jgi:hypothetical protein